MRDAVLTAADSAAAMAAASVHLPDVVLLDHHLDGGCNGLDFLDDLRRVTGRNVRALLITGDRSEEVRHAAKARGCEILLKPVKPAALRRFLSGEATRRLATQEDPHAA